MTINKESKKPVKSMRLPVEVWTMLEKLAEKDSRSLASMMEVLIKEAWSKSKPKR